MGLHILNTLQPHSNPMSKHFFSFQNMRGSAVVVCILTACYVLFVIFTMVKMSGMTRELHDYPYTASLAAREMKARIYGMRSTLPALFSTPGLPYAEIEAALKRQEKLQDASIKLLKERYLGGTAEIDAFDDDVAALRKARRQAAREAAGDGCLEVAEAIYRREVQPYLKRLDARLDAIAASAHARGEAMMARMDRMRVIWIFMDVLMGVALMWLVVHASRTERRKNREIAHREKLFNLLASTIDEVFFIFDREGECEYVSSNSGRVVGVPPEALLADCGKLLSFLGPEAGGWLETVLRDERLCDPVERDVSPQGQERRFRLRVYPIMEEGTVERRIAVLVDQTAVLAQRQALNDALEAARSANAAKTRFLSHMSHEIRTPMNAIIGMTAVATAKIDDRARVEDCLGKITLSSRYLLGLINDVLDMAKIEGGKLSIADEPFDFRQSVQSIVNFIQPQAQQRGLHFHIQLHGVDEEELRGDALRLNQILLNILSNALKFTPAGGSIHFDIHQLWKKGSHVRLRFVIRDTGIGISRDFLERLYDPFEQAASGAGGTYGGTGLGMTITQNLVTLLGGTIAVASEEGAGTEFKVELSFGLTGRQAAMDVLDPLKVLVVDDEQGVCEHAAVLLERMGLRVHWVLQGEEAVRLVVEASRSGDGYDVCFVDWRMPGMDGAETVRRLRAEMGPDTLIIIVSAYDWSDIEPAAREAGADAFIAKPFFASTLHDALAAVTRRSSGDAPDHPAAYDFSGKHILLVEDNEINREIAEEFLVMTGASVDCAENGQLAVEAFAAAPDRYDAILMDVQMPVMDGHEATRVIRASGLPGARTVPILAMTANAFSEDIAAALDAGMDAHIAKPLDMAVLCRLLDAHIGSGNRAGTGGQEGRKEPRP